MRLWFVALVVATSAAVPNAGADTSATTDAATALRTIRVTIAVKLQVDSTFGAVVTGVTNLPSRADLIVGLADVRYAARKIPNYYAQSHATVRGGKFRSQPFSYRGSPIPAGRYRVDVSMSAARYQPATVQAVIGRQGQALTGPLVHSGIGGKSVSYEKWFVIR